MRRNGEQSASRETSSPAEAGADSSLRERGLMRRMAERRRGSRTVVAASASDELASDKNSFSTVLARAMKQNPDAPLQEVLAGASREVLEPLHRQHPTIASSRGDVESKADSKQAAMLVANQNYHEVSKLEEPFNDAEGMRGALAARGFDDLGGVHKDKTAAEMQALYQSAAGGAQSGDSLLLFFSGHGMTEGLAGVDATRDRSTGILGHDVLQSLVDQASERGINTTVVSDACHSGAAAEKLRAQQMKELGAATKGTDLEALVGLAREIDGLKAQHGSDLQQRVAGMRDVDPESLNELISGVESGWLEGIKAQLRQLAGRFSMLTKQPLRSLKAIEALEPGRVADVADCIDDLTNEVLAFVESRRAADEKK